MDIAREFVAEVSGEPENLLLEEVALSPDGANFEVVYSFNRRLPNPNSLQKELGIDRMRAYKKIVVDRASGEVRGMFNWTFGSPQTA